MAQRKELYIKDIGSVVFQKRKASRYIKIRIKNNKVFVSLPYYTSYLVAKEIVENKKKWISETLNKTTSTILNPGIQLYGGYALCFASENIDTIKTKIVKSQKNLVVTYPIGLLYTSEAVQTAAVKVCERHLKKQAEDILPKRLDQIATKYGFTFSSVNVAKFTAKWGSCDHKQNIKLNYYLLQLPEELIDYVLVHELCHTIYLNHSADFWKNVECILPNYRELKKCLKTFSTKL